MPREVRDRDYFYLWSYSAWSVWVALGLMYVWERIAQMLGSDPVRVAGETVEVPRQSSWMAASPLLVIAIIPLFANWSSASRHGQTDTRDFAHDLLESVEPYGVLITVGDNDTFPLWYAQEVEGIRQDVTVLCTSLLNTDWYTRQLIRNPTRPYDTSHGPPAYAGRSWPMPTKPMIDLNFTQSDAVPEAVAMDTTQELKTASGYTFTIHPRDLGGGYRGLERADLFVLYIIRDAFPSRPFFFSRTDGSYPDEMGFTNYLVTTGLARKLCRSRRPELRLSSTFPAKDGSTSPRLTHCGRRRSTRRSRFRRARAGSTSRQPASRTHTSARASSWRRRYRSWAVRLTRRRCWQRRRRSPSPRSSPVSCPQRSRVNKFIARRRVRAV